MSSPAADDLLAPTLSGSRPIQPIYSVRAGFFTAFFGGPIASAVMTAVNAHRLGRLRKDAWVVVVGMAAAVMLLWWQMHLGGNEWLRSALGRSGPRFASRIVAFGVFGLSSLVHRPFYRHMEFAGIDSPSGWRAGIGAVLVAAVITVGLALLFAI
jgi:hypothetical protein